MTMLTEQDLKFIHVRAIRKIADSNNVEVHFNPDPAGLYAPSLIIGRKQLVLRLEKIASEIEPEYWAVREAALLTAQQARENLWPRTV